MIAQDIRPGQKGQIKIIVPSNWRQYWALYITVKYNGDTLLTKSFPLIRPIDVFRVSSHNDSLKKLPVPQLTELDSLFIVKANDVEYSFHKRTGLLIKIVNAFGEIPFNNGPIIQEGVNNFSSFNAHRDKDTLIIASSFDRKEHYNTLEWKIYPNGKIKMKVRYFPAAYFTSMVGVNFSYPENRVGSMFYLGDGPYRVWKNRMKGNIFKPWNKVYNNTETGESPWIYPEFKGYYSNFYFGEITGDTHYFTVGSLTENVFLRLFTPAWKTDQWHNYEPYFPSGDISFMQGIPSIGTKTQRNETTGPMGLKNIFYDYEKDPSRALQLELYFNFVPKGL